jgi:hypothetical protein
MKASRLWVVGLVGIAAFGSACSAREDASSVRPTSAVDPAAKPASGPKLNLSHIACTPDGRVNVHFVLLFAGNNTPGTLTGTYNGGSFSAAPEKNTGNVWHYNVYLPPGPIEILSASVVVNGATITLHNPGEYSGNYLCDDDEDACSVKVEPADLVCYSGPSNPGAECGLFGLLPQGKDDNLSGLSFVATQDAYVALVKSGTGGCGGGGKALRVYVNVHIGDVLYTPVDQDISHVTYCACPDP